MGSRNWHRRARLAARTHELSPAPPVERVKTKRTPHLTNKQLTVRMNNAEYRASRLTRERDDAVEARDEFREIGELMAKITPVRRICEGGLDGFFDRNIRLELQTPHCPESGHQPLRVSMVISELAMSDALGGAMEHAAREMQYLYWEALLHEIVKVYGDQGTRALHRMREAMADGLADRCWHDGIDPSSIVVTYGRL